MHDLDSVVVLVGNRGDRVVVGRLVRSQGRPARRATGGWKIESRPWITPFVAMMSRSVE